MVPEIPSFAVDDGFSYAVPDPIESLPIGSIVRIPVGGRRLRGWVVDVREEAGTDGRLREVLSRSGSLAIFDRRQLESMRWMARHYVAPLSTILPRAGPPNLPRGGSVSRSGTGPGTRTEFLAIAPVSAELIASRARPHLEAETNVAVLVPTVREAVTLSSDLESTTRHPVDMVTSSVPAAAATRTWIDLQKQPGRMVVGTREVAIWNHGRVGQMIVVDPGRRAFKTPSTPTLHVRDVARRRAAIERFELLFVGAVEPAELVAAGVPITTGEGRRWPLIELLDRRQEPPGQGPILDGTRKAIQGVAAGGGSVFVFVSRRGFAPAFRCARCGTLRRCEVCGAGPDRGDTCRRCGSEVGSCRKCGGARFQPLGAAVGRVVADLARSLGDRVGVAGSDAPVIVGTERDLPPAATRQLAVVVDTESLLLAPHYRAEEDALRVMARVAGTVERGRGRRALVQTMDPDQRVLVALRRGEPDALIQTIVAERIGGGLPPASELIAVELAGDHDAVDAELRSATGDDAVVLGPAMVGERHRWLVQGSDLGKVRTRLRGSVQSWRDRGFRVRVDADPIDL